MKMLIDDYNPAGLLGFSCLVDKKTSYFIMLNTRLLKQTNNSFLEQSQNIKFVPLGTFYL